MNPLPRSPPKTTKSPTKGSPAKTFPQIKLSLFKRKAFKIKTFSSKREERRLKISNEENKHTNVPLTLKIHTQSQDLFLSMKRKQVKILSEENKCTKMRPQPRRSNFWVKTFSFNDKETFDSPWEKRTSIQIVPLTPKTGLPSRRLRLSSQKSILEDGDRIRALYICLFATNIRDCTQIFWNTIQILFVHNFVITNSGTLNGTISTSYLFLQNQDFQVQTSLSSKKPWL